jgi:ABC-type branched-subunit amino acid transport system substrate-binding protein
MRRALAYVALASLFTGIFAPFCFADDRGSPSVGVLLPLSGPLSEMGKSFKRGIDLFRADHPESGVGFVLEDHKYDGKSAVTALHSLRANSEIKLVVVWGNTPSGAAAPVAEQQKLPMIAVSMNPDAKERRFVVSLGPPIKRVADKIVEQLRIGGVRQVGIVTIDIGNALKGATLIEQSFSGATIKKIVANEEVDFKAVISQLKTRGVDGVVLFLLPEQALTFLKQAKQFDYSPHIVGGDVFAVESFREQARQFTGKLNFVCGAVRPPFIDRLSTTPQGTSYFFEAATGYSVAAVSAALMRRMKVADATKEPLGELKSLAVDEIPLPSLDYVEDAEFGRHFELEVSSYPISF